MRFTKVLREYVNEELTKKRREADANDPQTLAYKARRDEAIEYIKGIQKEANKQALEIATSYGLTYDSWRNSSIISFDSSYLVDADECKAQREREKERYDKQQKAMQEIEVNCTLGADREEFMKMLADVSF